MKPLFLKKLSLINYKNFESVTFNFDAKINCFVGSNGIGKTNILDSIYHLAFGKSYFNPITSQNIKHGEDFFVIEGVFKKENREEKIICSIKKGQKKIMKRNDKIYERISDHIGFLPLVIISPADRDLITEGSDARRKFMDGVIAQSDKLYLQDLIRYNKLLSQRNSLLKYFAANNTFDPDALATYNEQMHSYGSEIYEKRKKFIETFIPIFLEHHQVISGGKEVVTIQYESQLKNHTLLELFDLHLSKDRTLLYSTAGIHKDDLYFTIENNPIKKFGSQGQQKSFLIALKLAQFDFIKKQSGVSPILLLDDIFDKLDEHRVSHIVSLVNDDHFGQIFISDTHPERTELVVKQTHQSYEVFPL